MTSSCALARNFTLAILLAAAATSQAAPFTVTTTADAVAAPPAGSLRKAIADAADGDTIEFDPAVTGTITLAGADLLLEKNLTVTGPGAAVLAVSGNQQSRIFRVSAGKTVAISGLTIRDGKSADGPDYQATGPFDDTPGKPGEPGGGILNEGTLTLTACWLTDNASGAGGDRSGNNRKNAGAGGSGGAIFSSSVLKLTDCKLSGNRAGIGGDLLINSGSDFTKAGDGGRGGAIYILTGDLQLLNSSFDQNSAGVGGTTYSLGRNGDGGDGGSIAMGGITSLNLTALIQQCSITRSRAGNGGGVAPTSFQEGRGGWGGGIYFVDTNVTLKSCTISGNQAGDVRPYPFPGDSGAGNGGGLACERGTVNLISCTVSNNVAGENPGSPPAGQTFNPFGDGWGGGIYNKFGGSSVTLRNTIVAANRDTIPSGSEQPGNTRDVCGAFVSEGHNLIGNDGDRSTGFAHGVNGDVVGSVASPVDPYLGVLADYGGPTLTHALAPGSPAIDAGDDSIVGADQRGQPRLAGAHVDIGAVEGGVQNGISFATAEAAVEESAVSVAIVVQRFGDTASAASVQFSTTGGTATEEADYTPASGTLDFAPGQTQAMINVPIVNDTIAEGPENLQVRLSSPSSNAIIFPRGTHTVTVFDDDGPGTLEFATGSSTQTENGGNALITVVRKHGAVGSVSVSYATVAGSASPDNDYVSTSGTLTFETGVTQQTFVIPIINDASFEGDETFNVQLSAPTGGTFLGTPTTHVVTIQDDETPPPPPPPSPTFDFQVAESIVSESGGSAFIKVVRTKNLAQAVSVSYQTSAGTATATADFIPAAGTFNFPASSTEQTIVVPIVNDDAIEGSETFTVGLSNPTGGAALGTLTTHTVTINDDDNPATVAFAGASTSVAEASGQAVVTLIRSGSTTSSATVQVSASVGSATSGSDYSFQTSTITFAPGVAQQTVTASLTDDGVEEGDEQFELVLSNPSGGATLGSQTTHTITILDDAEDVSEVRKASYRGLAASTDAGNPEYAGITVKTTKSGQLTGTVQIRGKTLRLKGRFSETGMFSQEFSRASLGSLARSSLQLQPEEGGAVLTGTLQVFNGPSFQVGARRDVVATRANPVAEANAYTALLQTELTGNPAGYLRTRVLPSGKISLSAMLPDGTRLSASSHLAEDRSFPIFFPAYAKRLGYLAGNARFDAAEPLPLTGDLHWQKPADSRPPYADGLTNAPVELFGSVYTPPRRQRVLDDFDATQGIAFLQFSTAAPPDPVAFNAMWNQDNTIRILPPEFRRPPSPIRVSLQPGTGLFTGRFRDAEGNPRKLFGICIQRPEAGEDLAVGFAAYGETSDRVEIVPQN